MEQREIPGYPGYRVSRDGTIWGLRGRPLRTKANPKRGGHMSVNLGARTMYIHRAVLLAFVGEPPPGHVCRHINGDPADNRLENLAWGTVAENHRDTIRHNRTTRGEKNTQSKLTTADVLAIRDARCRGVPLKQLAARYSVAESAISRVANGKRWAHVSE